VTETPDQSRYASGVLRWPEEVANLPDKLRVAARVAQIAAEGETIGIGSGSAAYLALWAIGRRAQAESLRLAVVPTSYETETAAVTLGLPMVPLGRIKPSWSVDGADEVDRAGRVLKGRGGALFREKLLWASSGRIYLAIDATKFVDRLGSRFPLPVEVHPAAVTLATDALEAAGARSCELRIGHGKDGPVITESGNLLVDAQFDEIPTGLHAALKQVPGVIETGLFEGYEYDVIGNESAPIV
jgi:ribose 5-phosphate isomerase A